MILNIDLAGAIFYFWAIGDLVFETFGNKFCLAGRPERDTGFVFQKLAGLFW